MKPSHQCPGILFNPLYSGNRLRGTFADREDPGSTLFAEVKRIFRDFKASEFGNSDL